MKAVTKAGKVPTRESPQDIGGLECSGILPNIYNAAKNVSLGTLSK